LISASKADVAEVLMGKLQADEGYGVLRAASSSSCWSLLASKRRWVLPGVSPASSRWKRQAAWGPQRAEFVAAVR
jgi:hypothetical protein